MKRLSYIVAPVALALAALILYGFWGSSEDKVPQLRVGYFPNITHAQAVVGVARGDFQNALGPKVKLHPVTFNAGPSVIEAIYGGTLDISYVGPSPAINGFLRSKGEEVRVIAGSANNGVLIVGNRKRKFTKLDQLRGKKLASPQLGNTQDISAKHFVLERLHTKLKENGGDTEVIPISNPDIEILFRKDQLDAAWVPEPWGSRLIHSGMGNIIAEERVLWPEKKFSLTSVIVRREFLKKHPDLVKKFLRAHVQLTKELQADPNQFGNVINKEMKRLTGKQLPAAVIEGSFQYTEFTTDPGIDSFQRFFAMGKELKLVRGETLEIKKLVQLDLLREVERESKVARAATTTDTAATTTSE